MNKKYFYELLWTFVLMVLMMNASLAQSFVNESFANTIGTNFIANKSGKANVQLNLIHIEKGDDGQPNLYIYNVEGGGSVIVSASKNVKPVLAYSLENSFDGEIPEHAWYFINNYSKTVDYCDERGILMNADVENEWKLLENNELPVAKNATAVQPLIQTRWNQNYPYNYYAPSCNNYWNGNHCYAGCVACAMSQIMKYWNHPAQGHGSHSYVHSTYGELSANFGETNYDFDIMPVELGYQVNAAARAVALLMYHCGVSVNMNFGPDSSGAYSPDVETAFRQYFGYCGAMYLTRFDYTEAEWIAILKNELDLAQPVYFSGTSDSGGGHAIVCDGYDNSDYFHFNLGWSGSGDDYYSINDAGGYHNNEAIVMNVKPIDINPDAKGIIYVAADGTGDGSSWENATPFIEYASVLSSDGITKVWVKTGTYYGNVNNSDGAFTIYKNGRIYGGFAGNEAPDFNLDDRDFINNPTIFDGQNARRVLYQNEGFQSYEYSVWDGFTIQNGQAGFGAGAYLSDNSRFVNCKFLNNNATGMGGAVSINSPMYNNSYVEFSKCTFEGNQSSIGAAVCDQMGARVKNCRFTNNTALTKGGAYYVYINKQPRIVNSIFDHNSAHHGGAVYNKGNVTMINCDIVDNQAVEEGGGLYNESSSGMYYNTVFWGNSAAGTPNQIQGSSVFRNCAVQDGCSGTHIITLSSDNDGVDGVNYPRFENPETGDYTISRFSACVDAGDKTVSGIVDPDFLGNQRIVNNMIDIGAIECQYGLSLDELESNAFVAYPNPVDNQLVIKADGAMMIEVFNSLGQKIASAEAQNEMILNTSEWGKGVYFVKVNGKTLKIVK